MIKARYGPSDEDLVEQMLSKLPPHKRDDEHRFSAMEALVSLRALGYEITRDIEITGDMEQALRSLEHPETYVKRSRPVRHVES